MLLTGVVSNSSKYCMFYYEASLWIIPKVVWLEVEIVTDLLESLWNFWSLSWGVHLPIFGIPQNTKYKIHVELHGYGPQGCLGHMTIERRHMNAQGDCESPGREREGERECTYLFPWDYISFGVGWTRWFFKMTIELPSFRGPTL